MDLQLIQGHFTAEDTIDIVTQMINIKIRYHESKIGKSSNEEDIKMREQRIKLLQQDLANVKKHIELQEGKIAVRGDVHLYQ